MEISLVNTAALSAQSFVTHCEYEYESRIIAAANELLAAEASVVMLTGPSASGKTTTAHKLSRAIQAAGRASTVISLDNFFLDIDRYPRLEDGTKDYENVTALDIPEINRCLTELVEKGETDIPEFDFVHESRAPQRTHIQLNDGVAVIEGIHALNPCLTEMVPGNIYKIYAGLREEYSQGGQRTLPTRDIRLARRMVRDHKFRGHTPQKTLDMWRGVCHGEDKYIRIFKPQADLLLDTSFSYEICALAPYVAQLRDELAARGEPNDALNDLANRFSYCNPLSSALIPPDSMLREFVGK